MRQHKTIIIIALFILSAFLTFSAALAAESSLLGGVSKVRVAVARFGATDRFAQVYGGWDIGGGLSAQLVTELIDTGKVIVVERAILSQIIREQELSVSKLVTKETAAQVGQLLGVDYLIVGQVTEFEQKAVGGGGRAGWLGGIFPKLSGEFTAAHVAIDMRIIDTSTGEILRSYRAEGRAWEKALAVDLSFPTITFGGDAFHKTPLGKATRKTIQKSVAFLLDAVQERLQSYSNWLAKVIHVEDQLIYLNAGEIAQIKVGDRLSAFSIKKVLTDPETNQVVGIIENPLAEMTVISVAEKFSTARVVQGDGIPKEGDVVRFAKEATLGGLASGPNFEKSSFMAQKYRILD